jgi:hypothetical protein
VTPNGHRQNMSKPLKPQQRFCFSSSEVEKPFPRRQQFLRRGTSQVSQRLKPFVRDAKPVPFSSSQSSSSGWALLLLFILFHPLVTSSLTRSHANPASGENPRRRQDLQTNDQRPRRGRRPQPVERPWAWPDQPAANLLLFPLSFSLVHHKSAAE